MSRAVELLKGAVELNLRYTSTLLHLSKDYLKDANDVLSRGGSPVIAPAEDAAGAPAARAPLLIVGRAGETGNGAFAINNPGGREMNVHLVVQGELDERIVRVEPARLALKPGEGAIVRILASFDDKLPANRDHVGSVVAPGLTNQGVPFIVRRLANDEDAAYAAASPAAAGAAAEPAAAKARAARGKH